MSKLKPIPFNTEMTKAILENRKTTTRRKIKGLPETAYDFEYAGNNTVEFLYGICSERVFMDLSMTMEIPYQIGDILWVRETWQSYKIKKPIKAIPFDFKPIGYMYKADDVINSDGSKIKWRPSIHMPFEAARIFLKVTGVHIEELQDITEEEAKREGAIKAKYYMHPQDGKTLYEDNINGTYREGFQGLWNSTIKKSKLPLYGWDANPYVWVIKFERIDKEDIPPELLKDYGRSGGKK
jgi:hypothetical protein